MFRTILTPLRARFELSPRTAVPPLPTAALDVKPEDFARDVLIEIMRNSVEKLKETTETKPRVEILDEIHRIMLQDPCTKDIFCQMDGFVAVISVITTVSSKPSKLLSPTPSDDAKDIIEAARLCFRVISEAMHGHAENTNYFKVCSLKLYVFYRCLRNQHTVGYGNLANAVRSLVADERTSDHTLGFLLGLALHDFSGALVFTTVRGEVEDAIDVRLGQFSECFGLIRRRGAFLTLWNYLAEFIKTDASLRFTTFRIIDTLSLYSHRNQTILSSLELVGPLFESLSKSTSDLEKSLLTKLLRRLLDMGSVPSHARVIFQRALKGDGALDLDVLELLRYSMRSRWLDHFSMEPSATLVATQEKVRGVPATGLTFMVSFIAKRLLSVAYLLKAWVWLEKLPKTHHSLFTAQSTRLHLQLRIDPNGRLELRSSSRTDAVHLPNSIVRHSRWAHIALVHYPHRASNPSIRKFFLQYQSSPFS